jgi:hypothetical protein
MGPRGGPGNSPSEAVSLTLLVVRGPYVGRQIQVSAGKIVRIGRTNRSDQAFPDDTYLIRGALRGRLRRAGVPDSGFRQLQRHLCQWSEDRGGNGAWG